MKHDMSIDVDWLADRLKPLFEGQPVALQHHTPTRVRPKRDPYITITPGSLLGWPREVFVVSVIGEGSCMLRLYSKREVSKARKAGRKLKPKIADLVRAGLSAKLAVVLVTTLQTLIGFTKEKRHGNSTTQRPSAPARRSASTASTFDRPRRCTPFREG
jgi:hypothetical protein